MSKLAWMITVVGLIGAPALAQTPAQGSIPDLRGIWKGQSESVVFGAGNDLHHGSHQDVATTIPLAFLAPELVRAVIDARLPRGIHTRRIAEPKLEWLRQWELLGIRP